MTVPPITQQPRITSEEVTELRAKINAKLDADQALAGVQRTLAEKYEIREGEQIDGFGYITRRPT